MADGISHWLDVRDGPAFLHRLMRELAGVAHISLEGDLSCCRFANDELVSYDETEVLKRNTLYPRQDFVILRLAPNTIPSIFAQVGLAGLKRAICHVQIERNGVLELGAYDNFHPECVVTGPGIDVELLADLKSKSVVRDYRAASVR